MSLLELLQKDYIRSPYLWKEMWINASKRDSDWDWIPIDKVRIRKIKNDKKFLPNEVDDDQISYMINNFDEEIWEPISINEDYCLLDGQHRLRLAFRTGMKYIDAIMEKRKDPAVCKRIKEERHRKYELQEKIRKLLKIKKDEYYKLYCLHEFRTLE